MRGLKWLVLVLSPLLLCPFICFGRCYGNHSSLHFFYQVLQRKTEEASAATKVLKHMIATRKAISHRSTG